MFTPGSPILLRGQTYQQGQTISTSDLPLVAMEGLEASFMDIDPSDKTKPRSGELVTCRLVRNSSGIALLPKRVVAYASGYLGKRVDGYTRTTAVWGAGVVDEFLPSAGAQNNDLFWIVTRGNTQVLTDLAASEQASIAEGGILVALTAATSQATTAGRVAAHTFTLTETPLANMILNHFGRALSANTTGQTDRSLLARVNFIF